MWAGSCLQSVGPKGAEVTASSVHGKTMVAPAAGEHLRILVVSQYFAPENFQINHFVKALHNRGHQVEVLTGKPNYPGGRFFEGYSFLNRQHELLDGVPVWRAPVVPRGSGGNFRLAINYISFAAAASVLGLLRVRGDFDCIFVYAPSPVTACLPALAIGRKSGVPVVLWVQDLWPESVTAASNAKWLDTVMPSLNWLVRRIYLNCARILIQSEAFRPSIERFGIAPERIAYLPQSVDALFKPVPLAEDVPAALKETGFRVVFAGNIGEAQDFETIVEAADRLREQPMRWIIIGDGRRRPWLEAEVRKRGLGAHIALPGSFPEQAMPTFFAHADALLVTLRRDPIFALTIPTKVQAYLASGRPIIAGLDGEAARIVKDAKAGVVARSGDPVALAAAVLTLMRMAPSERVQMGQCGLDYSRRNFDRDLLLDRLVAHFRAVKAAGSSGHE